MFLATRWSCDPGAQFPWRPVPYVLCMAARKVSYPIPQFILMKADDFHFHHGIMPSDAESLRSPPPPAYRRGFLPIELHSALSSCAFVESPTA